MRKTNEPVEMHRHSAEPQIPGSTVRRWSTGFLIVGSALVGTTAIALWNRHAIARLRSEIRANPPKLASDKDSEIV